MFINSYNNTTIKFDLINDCNKFACRNNKDYTVSDVSDYSKMPIHQGCQ